MNDPSRPSRLQWGLLAVIVAIAGITRFAWLASTEAHFDELWHLELSTGRDSMHGMLPRGVLISDAPAVTSLRGAPSWAAIWTNLSLDAHPPLHYVLLRPWRALFGESVPVGRAFSALFSTLCVPMLFAVVRRQFSPAIGLWAALIMALASAQIDQAQEIRNYSLTTLLVLGAALGAIQIVRLGASRGALATLGLSAVGAMLSNYFAAPVLAAIAICLAFKTQGPSRRRVAVTLTLAAGAYLLIWGPWLMEQMRVCGDLAKDAGALLDASHGRIARTIERFASAPVRLLFEPRTPMRIAPMLGATMYALPWLLLKRRPEVLLWAIWLTCVVGFAALLDVLQSTRHLELVRHILLAGPALYAILAGAFSGAKSVLVHGFPAIVSIACALSLPLTYTRQNPRYSDIGRALSDPTTRDEPVVFYSRASAPFFADLLYLGASHYSGTFPRPAAIVHDGPRAELLDSLAPFRVIWLVSADPGVNVAEIVPGTRQTMRVADPHLGIVARLERVDPIRSSE